MSYGLYMSAAGAHAQSHRMQVLSNNLANVDTPGFKPQQTVLQSRFAEMIAEGEVPAGLGGADDVGGGVTIDRAVTQFDMGAISRTGRQTDFAIEDDQSFFVVRRDGEQLLTRAGNFLFDASGRLVTPRGDAVMSTAGDEIRINPTLPYDIAAGGYIRQGNTNLALMLARPQSLGDLKMTDENHFVPGGTIEAVAPGMRRVQNGAIERSAVSPTAAMMEMIETTRVYEANVRLIQSQDSATGSLISRVLK